MNQIDSSDDKNNHVTYSDQEYSCYIEHEFKQELARQQESEWYKERIQSILSGKMSQQDIRFMKECIMVQHNIPKRYFDEMFENLLRSGNFSKLKKHNYPIVVFATLIIIILNNTNSLWVHEFWATIRNPILAELKEFIETTKDIVSFNPKITKLDRKYNPNDGLKKLNLETIKKNGIATSKLVSMIRRICDHKILITKLFDHEIIVAMAIILLILEPCNSLSYMEFWDMHKIVIKKMTTEEAFFVNYGKITEADGVATLGVNASAAGVSYLNGTAKLQLDINVGDTLYVNGAFRVALNDAPSGASVTAVRVEACVSSVAISAVVASVDISDKALLIGSPRRMFLDFIQSQIMKIKNNLNLTGVCPVLLAEEFGEEEEDE